MRRSVGGPTAAVSIRAMDEPVAGQVVPPRMPGFGGLADRSDGNRRIMSLVDEEFGKVGPEDPA